VPPGVLGVVDAAVLDDVREQQRLTLWVPIITSAQVSGLMIFR
jgi:hypothetical protein